MTVKRTRSEKSELGSTMPPIGETSPLDVSQTLSPSQSPKKIKGIVDGSNMNSRWIAEHSKEQIRLREEYQRKKAEKDVGMKCLAGLKRQLIVNYGSIHVAWRQALDLDGNGRLSFGEFCIAMRNLGYGGNVKAEFHALDQDDDGFISLHDIDPQVDEEISSYKKLVLEKYPNMLIAWRECLNAGGSGQVDEKMFGEHCKRLGW